MLGYSNPWDSWIWRIGGVQTCRSICDLCNFCRCYFIKAYRYSRFTFRDVSESKGNRMRPSLTIGFFTLFMLGSLAMCFAFLLGNGSLPSASLIQSPLDNDYRYEECINGTVGSTLALFLIILSIGVLFIFIFTCILWVNRHLYTSFREHEFLTVLVSPGTPVFSGRSLIF